MRMKYIAKIQAGLRRYRVISTNKRTSQILDGSYRSVFKGRSMNFDELREYVAGDDVKDIDWKASSRSQKILVRQYVAERKHNIMLIMDTNRRMLAYSAGENEKRELAILGGGTLAYLVNSNGDYVSATYATKEGMVFHPFRTGLMNIELILDKYHNAVTMDNRTDLNESLDYVMRNFRRRMIVVLVTDRDGILSLEESTVRRLMVAHDILLIQVGDADFDGQQVFDMEREQYLPDFLTKNPKLTKIAKEKRDAAEAATTDKILRLGISCTTVNNVEDMDDQILEMLNRNKNEKMKEKK